VAGEQKLPLQKGCRRLAVAVPVRSVQCLLLCAAALQL
jgi:hypothetical protein